ncbi:hypothetical protein SAMN05216219_1156 [Mycetocola miduiensis]|uniref:Uncharacterized protein n=1 Tax=Mycetocola miduiensis TaxID=995034 RepID=A0A1I4ZX91_9MICO|nr:hypothetical protein SAMN05216219_1156 [Mycetocola miduiensis]
MALLADDTITDTEQSEVRARGPRLDETNYFKDKDHGSEPCTI